MITLLASNHPGILQPSPPASTENGASIFGLELLQLAVIDLYHVHGVYGRCLDDHNINYSSQTKNLNDKAVLQAYVT